MIKPTKLELNLMEEIMKVFLKLNECERVELVTYSKDGSEIFTEASFTCEVVDDYCSSKLIETENLTKDLKHLIVIFNDNGDVLRSAEFDFISK